MTGFALIERKRREARTAGPCPEVHSNGTSVLENSCVKILISNGWDLQ